MENDLLPICRQCPSNEFELTYVSPHRYMAICHAKECVLQPEFPCNSIREGQYLSKSNVDKAVFTPLENCPHVEKLRRKGILPWGHSTINFLNQQS